MSITQYFRNALAAQLNPRMNLKDNDVIKVTLQQIEAGMILPTEAEKLFSAKSKNDSEEALNEVLISVKTVTAKISGGTKVLEDIDEPTGIFFLPATLSQDGTLRPSSDKYPWFVREFLWPTVDSELCIGREYDVDRFLSENELEYAQVNSWGEYWNYARKMYEEVTHSDLYSNNIGNLENVHIDEGCYIFPDTTIDASRNIRRLYEEIGSCEDTTPMPLYKRFTSTAPMQIREMLKNDTRAMKKHAAQMGGEYALSPSQRESINHLNALKNGEILAVSGPPGTGKTTLLQSVTADLLTQCALEQKDPPIIVAASTNNQAVTNIIDSFSKISSQGLGNLERRWVTVADGFAVYFPSVHKYSEAKEKGYQIGKDMLFDINSQKQIDDSSEKMIQECSTYFERSMMDVEQCKNIIYKELATVDNLRSLLIDSFSDLINGTKGKTVSEYLTDLRIEQAGANQLKQELEQSIQDKHQLCESYNGRIKEWTIAYQKLAWHIRFLAFLPRHKEKILRFTNQYKRDDELLEFIDASTPNAMIEQYHNKILTTEDEIYEIRCSIARAQQFIDGIEEEIVRIERLLNDCATVVQNLKECHSVHVIQQDSLVTDILANCTLDKLNDLLDVSARYVEFWLAVHYYECVWLACKPFSEKQISANIDNVVCDKLHRIALLSPCMVMTFYMLPSQFRVYNINEEKSYYLHNFIDLLIVDEAGQTSPEVAAASFSLAKRAIVVGDEYQIPPVWGIKRHLDITLAMQAGVINKPEDFLILENSGLNTSQSSVMRVALRSCPYNKYDGGLFLSEHRRCYDEIISYCNELVYNGKLIPLRGRGHLDSKRSLDIAQYPIMGYYNIPTLISQKAGSSRINIDEANGIAMWLQNHYDELCTVYEKEKILEEEIFAIITPFKAQVNVIKHALQDIPDERIKKIDVGTVHTFQGAERRIIIFSTTYGSEDGCYFIEKNSNLMNVAVSRAKDAFWVFGSVDSLKGSSEEAASGLLYQYISKNRIPPSGI